MDTAAFLAHQVKYLMNLDKFATQPLNAMAQEKFSAKLLNAISAKTAQQTLFQIPTEDSV